MLYKREIEGLPLLPPPKIPKNSKYRFCAAAAIHELPRSGRVFVADFYKGVDGPLAMRYVTDGKNFISCTEWPAKTWGKKGPRALGWYWQSNFVYSPKESDGLAKEFIGEGRWRSKLIEFIEGQVSDYNYDTRQKREESKRELAKKHRAMYPALPDGLEDWCDEHLFHGGYIFFTKKDPEGVREARCGICGHEFEPPRDVRHNRHGRCPKCGRDSIYKAEWIRKMIDDTKQLCIAERVDGDILLRWMNVSRSFGIYDFKKRYTFSDSNYNLHLNTPKGKIHYSYAYWGYMDRRKNGDFCTTACLLYTPNLDSVFGERYHDLHIRTVAENAGEKLRFGKLLNDLEKYPQTEYLLKLGLTNLADEVSVICADRAASRGFTDLLGVSKQLLPVYQSMDVTYREHRMIRACGSWVSEEQVEDLRRMKITGRTDAAEAVLQKMSMQKFINYFHKQSRINPDREVRNLITEYRDYLEMALTLKIDLSHKSVRYPSDVVAAHSRLLTLCNQLDDKKTAVDEAFAAAVAPIYESIGFTRYTGKEYIVVFPQYRSDLITEGQSLSHCVGTIDKYYKNHMAGTQMIFFIRKASAPDKPFVTMEVDMQEFSILQIYGFGDHAPAKDVKKFASQFVQELKKAMKKGRKAA